MGGRPGGPPAAVTLATCPSAGRTTVASARTLSIFGVAGAGSSSSYHGSAASGSAAAAIARSGTVRGALTAAAAKVVVGPPGGAAVAEGLFLLASASGRAPRRPTLCSAGRAAATTSADAKTF